MRSAFAAPIAATSLQRVPRAGASPLGPRAAGLRRAPGAGRGRAPGHPAGRARRVRGLQRHASPWLTARCVWGPWRPSRRWLPVLVVALRLSGAGSSPPGLRGWLGACRSHRAGGPRARSGCGPAGSNRYPCCGRRSPGLARRWRRLARLPCPPLVGSPGGRLVVRPWRSCRRCARCARCARGAAPGLSPVGAPGGPPPGRPGRAARLRWGRGCVGSRPLSPRSSRPSRPLSSLWALRLLFVLACLSLLLPSPHRSWTGRRPPPSRSRRRSSSPLSLRSLETF